MWIDFLMHVIASLHIMKLYKHMHIQKGAFLPYSGGEWAKEHEPWLNCSLKSRRSKGGETFRYDISLNHIRFPCKHAYVNKDTLLFYCNDEQASEHEPFKQESKYSIIIFSLAQLSTSYVTQDHLRDTQTQTHTYTYT